MVRHRRLEGLCLGSEGGSEGAPTTSDSGCYVNSRGAGARTPPLPVVSLLRLAGCTNIAAGTRRCARQIVRPLRLLGLAM